MSTRAKQTALEQLEERLKANGVGATPHKVASAILGLARLNEWTHQPERAVEWLEQLALDVGQHPPADGTEETYP